MRWINREEAIFYLAKGLVSFTLGDDMHPAYGGYRHDGSQSILRIPEIIAIHAPPTRDTFETPRLTNKNLFKRDKNRCGYCGNVFHTVDLTRDHIHPVSRGGKDTWINCVSACYSCNNRKGSMTIEEANMPLVIRPHYPTKIQLLFNSNVGATASQVAYLRQCGCV